MTHLGNGAGHSSRNPHALVQWPVTIGQNRSYFDDLRSKNISILHINISNGSASASARHYLAPVAEVMFSLTRGKVTTDTGRIEGLNYAKRGELLDDNDFSTAGGVDTARMRARALLTVDQEKKLLRRMDWHIMPLCALMFLMKNLDSNNVGNESSILLRIIIDIPSSGLKHPYYESRNKSEYFNATVNDF